MIKKLVFIFGLLVFAQSAMALEPGTSSVLARSRAKQLSNISYEINFSIPKSIDDRIEGVETITFDLKEISDVILDAQVTRSGRLVLNSVDVNSKSSKIGIVNDHIDIPKTLLKKGTNAITMSFLAGEAGFHRRDDFIYTLFVPDNASKTFPCFDQPDLKAILNLTLRFPKDWIAVSQGSIKSVKGDSPYKIVEFNSTKPTSTYLFAFAAGEFEVIKKTVHGREMTMYHRETDKKKLNRNVDDIFEIHSMALQWLEDYTGIRYPFEKFAFVLLPAFPFSGMEHPGSIFYADKSLLLDESATESQYLNRAIVIAHETSHMWFGDLATMQWFNDVWMKEVFANFMADKIINPLFSSMNHNLRFFFSHYPEAYSVDRTAGSNPVQQDLENLKNASSLYGDIIYNKAPIAVRQLEKIVGQDAFKEGQREYLKTYSFKNATWSDQIDILSQQTKKPLAKWNKAWIKETGRPKIKIEIKNSSLEIKTIDPQRKKRFWPQTLDLQIGIDENKAVSIPLELDKPNKIVALPKNVKSIKYILTSATDPGYGLFILDSRTIGYLKNSLEKISDENVRAVAWVNLRENMLEHNHISPREFIELAIRTLPQESQPLTLDFVLNTVQYAYWSLISEKDREQVAPALESLLWKQTNTEKLSSLSRTSYFKSYVNIFISEEGWNAIYNIWKGKTKIKDISFSENDFMDMTYALILRKPKEGPELIKKQLSKIDDPERKKEFQFVANALAQSQSDRDEFYKKLLEDDGRKNEPWAIQALSLLNHPLWGADSEKYIEPSLEALTRIKATTGIFFPKSWLNTTLNYHVDNRARKTVTNFLKAHPDLDNGLRLKLLQASDTLYRFTTPK